jgi:hypothetical protein
VRNDTATKGLPVLGAHDPSPLNRELSSHCAFSMATPTVGNMSPSDQHDLSATSAREQAWARLLERGTEYCFALADGDPERIRLVRQQIDAIYYEQYLTALRRLQA